MQTFFDFYQFDPAKRHKQERLVKIAADAANEINRHRIRYGRAGVIRHMRHTLGVKASRRRIEQAVDTAADLYAPRLRKERRGGCWYESRTEAECDPRATEIVPSLGGYLAVF